MLENCGYEVSTAPTGHEGFRRFIEADRPFDLVILDLVLPDMSGDELLLKIREADQRIKTILATGHIDDERISFMTAHGLNGYIHKPYSINTLSEKVNEILMSKS
jgi:DNA-binding response OmpR family regulator